jgi:hypothetical protein
MLNGHRLIALKSNRRDKVCSATRFALVPDFADGREIAGRLGLRSSLPNNSQAAFAHLASPTETVVQRAPQ